MPGLWTPVEVRWMVKRDFIEAAAIAESSSPDPWTEEDFVRAACRGGGECFVAELGGRVAGYGVWRFHEDSLEILDLAVAPDLRRRGVGTQLMNRLKTRLRPGAREAIFAGVRETELPAQKFLAANGFLAWMVAREAYEDTGEDSYQFSFHLPAGVLA